MNNNEHRLYREWSQSYPLKHPDNLHLDNPYYGKYLFKLNFNREPRPNMTYLLDWEYGRTWKQRHAVYILKRNNKNQPTKFKPDVYFRRRMMERMEQKREENEAKAVNRSTKYVRITKKIDNRK